MAAVALLLGSLLLQPPPATGAGIALNHAVGPRPVETLMARCIPFKDAQPGSDAFSIGDCRPLKSGELGEIGGRRYVYVLYCVIARMNLELATCDTSAVGVAALAQRPESRAVAIFVGAPGSSMVRLLLERSDPQLVDDQFEVPQVVTNAFGTFLYLPIHGEGTRGGNDSEYFLWRPATRTWQPIAFDERALHDRLYPQAPAGLTFNGCGLWPDLKTMRMTAGLKVPEDAHCSEAAGTADVELTIRNNAFDIASIKIVRQR